MLDATGAIAHLNAYSFDAIWNSTQSEERVNVALGTVNDRMQVSSVYFRRSVVGLPTTDLGMVYYMPFDLLSVRSTNLLSNTWYDLTSFLNKTQMRLCLYDTNGVMVPMSQAWVYVFEQSNELIVFVSKKAMMYLPGGLASSLFLTAYYNAKITNPVTSYAYLLDSNSYTRSKQIQTLNSFIASAPVGQVSMIQNGYLVDPSGAVTYSAGDCIDVIVDTNIMTTYTVDVDTNTTGYMSALYNGYRELLHCPKAQNPNNWITTHDSATLYVMDALSNRGVLLHRANAVSVEQVTHNDLSVDRNLLNALKAALNTTHILVKVVVHTPYETNVLPIDENLIQDLYLCPDADIVQHMRGAIDSTLTCWTAPTLESSTFLTMMFSNGGTTTSQDLANYVTGLGFFGVCQVLGGNVYTGTYVGSEMVITLPYALQGYNAIPYVFVNGRKVPQLSTAWSVTNKTQMLVDINPQFVKDGDAIAIVVYTDTPYDVTRFSPTQDAATINFPDDQYTIYKEVTIASTAGYKTTSTIGYLEQTVDQQLIKTFTESDGSITYGFTLNDFGSSYLFVPKSFMWAEAYNIDSALTGQEALIFPIHLADSSHATIPAVGSANINVFINGYALTEGVDFTYIPETLDDGTIVFTDLVVSNREYLNVGETGNVMEVFLHSDVELTVDTGYAYQGILPRANRPSVWYPRMGTAIVDGLFTTGLVDQGTWLSGNVRDGALFRLSDTYINTLDQILTLPDEAANLNNIKVVDTYLGRNTPTPPAVMPITKQHLLYSPYLMAIIADILSGEFVAVVDSNPTTFLAQFSDYDYLKARDPVLSQNGLVDRRYCAVAASYTQFATPNPHNLTIIQTLITAMGVGTTGTIGDTLV